MSEQTRTRPRGPAEQRAAPSPAARASLDDVVQSVGERIKTLRLRNELTLQDLAERTGLSLSMLSTVERGKTTASIGTLHAIAQGLGVDITTLFAKTGNDDSPIIPLESQIRDVTPGGMRRRAAVYRSDLDIEIYVDEYDPGTSHARRPSQHPGHEFGIVIDGDLEIQLDGEIHAASEGDAAQFPAKHSHLIRNTSDRPARAVWINLRRL
jgi:transcriptional regulator with XRE-family HTH domain